MRKAKMFGLLTKVGVITLFFLGLMGLASTHPQGVFPMAALAASPLEQVIEGAKKEGKIVIYESQPPKAWAKIMKSFQKRYPFIREWDHERLPVRKKLRVLLTRQKLVSPLPTCLEMRQPPCGLSSREASSWRSIGRP